jgi:hypothetical protein
MNNRKRTRGRNYKFVTRINKDGESKTFRLNLESKETQRQNSVVSDNLLKYILK